MKGIRDMFRRLLYLSVRKNIDLNIAFQYQILPETPCFQNPDGPFCKKLKLTNYRSDLCPDIYISSKSPLIKDIKRKWKG